MVAENEKIFTQIYNTILKRVKKFLNVKMVNLEKIKQENCQPHEDLPLHHTPTPFFSFSDSPHPMRES